MDYKNDCYCRKDNVSDEVIAGEQFFYDPIFEGYQGGLVMDIGGCIGAFTRRAIKHFNVKSSIIYEPYLDNHKMIHRNTDELGADVKVIYGAIAPYNGFVEFYETATTNYGRGGVDIRGPNARIASTSLVPAFCFQKEVNKYKPEIIKMDIEAAEYGLDFSCLKNVRAFAIEIHGSSKVRQQAKAPCIIKEIELAGFNVDHVDMDFSTLKFGRTLTFVK